MTLRITFKLYAGLTQYLPLEVRQDNSMPLELREGTSILEAIAPFNLPMKIVKLVLVNGVYVAPEQWGAHTLREGDVLAIWPPVAGG